MVPHEQWVSGHACMYAPFMGVVGARAHRLRKLSCVHTSMVASHSHGTVSPPPPVRKAGKVGKLYFRRTEAEAQILWSPNEKSGLLGKDPDGGEDGRQKGKGMAEDEMIR